MMYNSIKRASSLEVGSEILPKASKSLESACKHGPSDLQFDF